MEEQTAHRPASLGQGTAGPLNLAVECLCGPCSRALTDVALNPLSPDPVSILQLMGPLPAGPGLQAGPVPSLAAWLLCDSTSGVTSLALILILTIPCGSDALILFSPCDFRHCDCLSIAAGSQSWFMVYPISQSWFMTGECDLHCLVVELCRPLF